MSDWQDESSAGPPGESHNSRSFYKSNNYNNSNFRGRGGRGGAPSNSNWRARGEGNRDNRQNSRPQYDGNKQVITIPSNKVGRVIGKGGSKIRELEYETEAKIKIGDSSGETTEISLFGTDEAISKVSDMIAELAKDYVRPPPRDDSYYDNA